MKITLRYIAAFVLGLALVGQVQANWDEDQERGLGQQWERHGKGRKNLKPVLEQFDTPVGKDEYPKYHENNGIRCYRNDYKNAPDAIKGDERRKRCAAFGVLDNPSSFDAEQMERLGKAWFFHTNNPRLCRDKCLTDTKCRAFSWRPITQEIGDLQLPTCRVFTEELKSLGLKVDLYEKDTEDGWIYWDRACGRCEAADFVPGQLFAVPAPNVVLPPVEQNA